MLSFSNIFLMSQPSLRHRGVTLVELLVVIVILGILAAIAVPSYRTVIERWRVSSATDEMAAALNLTRSNAVTRNGNVTIAKLTGANCPTNQDWSCGWQVFWDANANGAVNTGDEVLQVFALPAAASNSGVTVMRSATGASMTANRWGQLSGVNAVGFTISPKPTGVSSVATKTICMNSGGRIRILDDSVTCPTN